MTDFYQIFVSEMTDISMFAFPTLNKRPKLEPVLVVMGGKNEQKAKILVLSHNPGKANERKEHSAVLLQLSHIMSERFEILRSIKV